jgi:hypothetical protein
MRKYWEIVFGWFGLVTMTRFRQELQHLKILEEKQEAINQRLLKVEWRDQFLAEYGVLPNHRMMEIYLRLRGHQGTPSQLEKEWPQLNMELNRLVADERKRCGRIE